MAHEHGASLLRSSMLKHTYEVLYFSSCAILGLKDLTRKLYRPIEIHKFFNVTCFRFVMTKLQFVLWGIYQPSSIYQCIVHALKYFLYMPQLAIN